MILVHVTYVHALESIAENGLLPGRGGKFGGGYAEHSKGRIFLCDAEGAWFWMMRLGNEAGNLTDNPEEGWAPITLAVDLDPEVVPAEDKLGTVDSLAGAYYVTKPIPPERIRYLDGDEWRPIEEVDPERLMSEVLDASEFVEADGGYWLIEDEYFLLTDAELRSAES